MSWNPIRRIMDTQKRKAIKNELVALLKKTQKAGEGIAIENDDGSMTNVIEWILRENPEFGLAVWPSGPAIVRRADIDGLAELYREKNKASGFLYDGGADFSMDNVKPNANGGDKISEAEYERTIGRRLNDAEKLRLETAQQLELLGKTAEQAAENGVAIGADARPQEG
jgi:hypothetical protein